MNPQPFSSLNHFTLPTAIGLLPYAKLLRLRVHLRPRRLVDAYSTFPRRNRYLSL
jgi:hypothetical protein